MADKKREPQIEGNTSSRSGAGDNRSDPDTQAVTETDSDSATREIGGRKGPDPVRYGDWEKQGRCIDF